MAEEVNVIHWIIIRKTNEMSNKRISSREMRRKQVSLIEQAAAGSREIESNIWTRIM